MVKISINATSEHSEEWHPAAFAVTLREIGLEYLKSRTVHDPFRGPHEGYAVLLEELDELWETVKAWKSERQLNRVYMERLANAHEGHAIVLTVDEMNDDQMQAMRKEARHVAAMALAFLIEVAP